MRHEDTTCWQDAFLDDVCDKITDGAHHSPKSVVSGLPMASVKDLTPFGIKMEACRKISKMDFDKLVRQGCKPEVGDVLIAKDGASALDTVCEVKKPIDVVLLSSVAILRPNKAKILPSFLRYYLDADTTRSYMKNAFTTGAAIPRVVLKDFKRASIRLPTLITQQEITAILSAYDDLTENNTRRIKILEEMAHAIYREWFVKFRFPGHEKVKMTDSPLGPIPKGWRIMKLGEIAGINELSIKKNNEPDQIEYIDIKSVGTGFIESTTSYSYQEAPGRARRIVRDGDIIWATVRPNRRSYSLILDPVENLIVSTGFAVLTPKNAPFTYLYHCVTTNEFAEYLVNHATGAAYPAVNAKDFSNAAVLMPDKRMLGLFNDAVEPMYKQKHVMAKKNNILRNTRGLLLPRLISGELSLVTVDDREAALG